MTATSSKIENTANPSSNSQGIDLSEVFEDLIVKFAEIEQIVLANNQDIHIIAKKNI